MSSQVQDDNFLRVLLILFYSFVFWIFQNGATSRHFVSQIKQPRMFTVTGWECIARRRSYCMHLDRKGRPLN